MAFTFVEIEERKTRRLLLLFTVLAALYAVSLLALAWGVGRLLGFPGPSSVPQALLLVIAALAAAAVHWAASTPHLVDRVLAALLAKPPDPRDTYHAQLGHIVEEVTVATGGRRRIVRTEAEAGAVQRDPIQRRAGRASCSPGRRTDQPRSARLGQLLEVRGLGAFKERGDVRVGPGEIFATDDDVFHSNLLLYA